MSMAREGIRVLDFSQMMLGPWGTQFLGDMGAEVLKIERPGVREWERGLPAMVGLFHKQRTGQGQRIDVNLFNTALALQCQELAAFLNMSQRWECSGSGIRGAWLAVPCGIYKTRDGYLAIAMASLATLGEPLDLPQLNQYDTPERAYADRDTIKPIIEEKLLGGTTEHWLALLATKDI